MTTTAELDPRITRTVDLTDLLATRPTGQPGQFVGESDRIGSPSVYGGQLIAQSIHAAYATVATGQHITSLHAYFIRPAAHRPITYTVETINDGRAFAFRQVIASQEDREVFRLTAAFATDDLSQPHRLQQRAPTSAPEHIPGDLERLLDMAEHLPPYLRQHALVDRGMDFRSLHPVEFLSPRPLPPHNTIWMRSKRPLGDAQDPMHRVLLGYASDYGLLPTANFPHALSFVKGELRMASIDHAMHFHRPFRLDEWLRLECDSPAVHAGRALSQGAFYDARGDIVATVVQQGLMMHGPSHAQG